MRQRNEDLVIHVDSLPWIDLGDGAEVRVIRTDLNTGYYAIILKAKAGSVFPAHKHLGAAEFIILKGRAQYSDTSAGVGDYGYEANYAIHAATTISEDIESFFVGYGPLMMIDEAGNSTGQIIDAQTLDALAKNAAAAQLAA
jgi:anti-sigma factor ChrR (cupin superfamily)